MPDESEQDIFGDSSDDSSAGGDSGPGMGAGDSSSGDSSGGSSSGDFSSGSSSGGSSSGDSSSDSSSGSSSSSSSSSSSGSSMEGMPTDDKGIIQKAVQVMNESGLAVQPSDDPLEVLKHVITAHGTAKATKEHLKAEQGQPQTGAGAAGGANGQTTEEQRPYLMSTEARQLLKEAGIQLSTVSSIDAKAEQDPSRRALLMSLKGFIRHGEKKTREHIDERIKKLAKYGAPPYKVKDWTSRATGLQLSINDVTGSFEDTKLQVELQAWGEALKHSKAAKKMLSTLTGASPEPHPLGTEITGELEKLAKEQAAQVSKGAAAAA